MNPPLTVHHGQEPGLGIGQNGALGCRVWQFHDDTAMRGCG